MLVKQITLTQPILASEGIKVRGEIIKGGEVVDIIPEVEANADVTGIRKTTLWSGSIEADKVIIEYWDVDIANYNEVRVFHDGKVILKKLPVTPEGEWAMMTFASSFNWLLPVIIGGSVLGVVLLGRSKGKG